MSQPEWMQKFQQIGQKSQVDTAGTGSEDKFSKFEKKTASAANANIPEWMKKKSERNVEDTKLNAPAPKRDDDSDNENDAAALFAAAGEKPAAVKSDGHDEDAAALFAATGSALTSSPTAESSGSFTAEELEMVEKYKKMMKMGMPEGAVMQKMSVDEVPKKVQDAVFGPSEDPIKSDTQDIEEKSGEKQTLTSDEEEMVARYKKMFKMGMPEGAVMQKMTVDEVPPHVQEVVLAPESTEEAGTTSGEVVEEEIIEEIVDDSVVEESVFEENVTSPSVAEDSVVEDSVVSKLTSQISEDGTQDLTREGEASKPTSEEEAGTAATATPGDGQKMTDEEFGEPWVIDKDRFLRDVGAARFEEVEVERDTGNVHYEEVFIDENGNEVAVPLGELADGEVQALRQEYDENEEEEVFVDEDEDEEDWEEGDPASLSAEFFKLDDDDPLVAQVQEVKDNQSHTEDEEEEEPVEPPYDPDYDVENQIKLLNRGTKKYRSRMAPWLPYVFLCAIVAAVLLVLFFVILADDDGIDPQSVPTEAPTPRDFIPLDPTNPGAIDVAATTSLDPVSGDCLLSQSIQPHVIDQCACTGSIDIIADDIRQRYDSLRVTFMPSVVPGFDEDISSCDPSNQALVWLSSGVNNAGEAQAFVRRERYVLAYFYMEQGGIGWSENRFWLAESDVCTWDRITCNQSGGVTAVDLTANSVIGQLSWAISLMENLEVFSVASNTLEGSIPEEIFLTPNLRSLDLSANSFSGEIPSLPANSTLEMLNLGANNLSGTIPSTVGNALSLSTLNLADNSVSGSLPTELFELPLLELYLAPNLLNGTIPESIGDLSSLIVLTLGPNRFTGEIPGTIGNMNNLTSLIIEDTPELSGRLPATYGIGLTNLKEFILTDTDVGGNIPQQFGLMTALEVLDMSRNSLGRLLPAELGLMTSLRVLRLDNNAFTGSIPVEIGNAIEMVELQLQVNQLTGSIPSSIKDMRNLELLNLDGNFLSGRVSEEVCLLRQEQLVQFTVDCPERVDQSLVTGVICSIPSCCTACF